MKNICERISEGRKKNGKSYISSKPERRSCKKYNDFKSWGRIGKTSDIQKKDVLEQTSCISFYAAECSEFPVLGEVHHDLSLLEALEAYEKIPAERMNGIKSVGFNLQEGSDYDGMMDLMVAGRSQREILDSIPFYKENKLVQEVLKRVEQYIEEKSLNVEKTRPKEEKGEIQKTKSQKRREDMSL